MKIKITKYHIAAGIREACSLCPIALAVKEMFPDSYVYVSDRIAVFPKHPSEWKMKKWSGTQKMLQFIENFDNGLPVKPTTFTVKEML